MPPAIEKHYCNYNHLPKITSPILKKIITFQARAFACLGKNT